MDSTKTSKRPSLTSSDLADNGKETAIRISAANSAQSKAKDGSVSQRSSIVNQLSLTPRTRTAIGIESNGLVFEVTSEKSQAFGPELLQWQDGFPPATLALFSPSKRKQLSATWELITTERDYVRDLNLINEVGFIIYTGVFKAVGWTQSYFYQAARINLWKY